VAWRGGLLSCKSSFPDGAGKEAREEVKYKPHLKIGLSFEGAWSCASCFEHQSGAGKARVARGEGGTPWARGL